jgi:hypothetical protein
VNFHFPPKVMQIDVVNKTKVGLKFKTGKSSNKNSQKNP